MITCTCRSAVKMVLIMSVGISVTARERGLLTLSEMERIANLEIPGAKVAKSLDAERIAGRSYHGKVGGLLANEGAGVSSIVELGFEVKNFAKPGDKVWEVHIAENNGLPYLRAILWVHPETGSVYFVCGPWKDDTRGPPAGAVSAPVAKISGTKVETESDAERLAFDNYMKRMNGNISATEAVREVVVVVLGYDVDGFAKRGEKIWEARVMDNQALRAIIWVNRSGDVHFVFGPWEAKTE